MDRAELQIAFEAALAELKGNQLKFVLEYLKHGNGQQAAEEAGYSAKTARNQASRMLTIVNIKAAIELGRQLLAAQAVMDAQEVRERWAARGRASIADVIALPGIEPSSTDPPAGIVSDEEEDDEADTAEQFNQHYREIRRRRSWALDLVKAQQTGGIHQIKKIKHGKYGVEIEMYDPLPAQELIARDLKMLGDETGIMKLLDLTKLSAEQLQRIADGEDPLRVILTSTTEGQSAA